MPDLEETKLHRTRGDKALVHEHIHRIRMVDGEELHLVGVCRLPELLGKLENVAPVARLERFSRDTEVFLRRARWSEGAASTHET